MAKTITENAPGQFTAGETVEWYENLPDFKPADGWTLTVELVFTNDKKVIIASDNGDGRHLVELTGANSADYATGTYRYQLRVDDGTKTHIVESGTIEVCQSYALTDSGYDGRSHAHKVLDAIQAILEGKANSDQGSLSVEGRSLSRYTWDELMDARARYRWEFRQEQNAERVRRGLPVDTLRQVRFI